MKIANIERNDNLNRWEIILAEPGRASAVFVKDEVLSNPDDIKKLIEIYGKEFYEKIQEEIEKIRQVQIKTGSQDSEASR